MKRLRFALLSLLGPGADGARPDLSDEDWQRIDAMAAAHRLRPHLHGRLQRGELGVAVPSALRERWKEAHRSQAITALAQQQALLSACETLQAAGFAPIALKGAWLAWHAYPAAAERPMRDIDVLVEPDEALSAFETLEAAGWDAGLSDRSLLNQIAARERHLPPLRNADGVWLELHGRAWDSGFALAQDRLRKRAVRPGPVHYPHPHDMLTHLAIHAGPSHAFNLGPLILSDVAYLVAVAGFDWPKFWAAAEESGTDRAIALVMGLADRWSAPGVSARCACPLAVSENVIEEASELLLQEPAARKDIALLSGLSRAGTGGVLRKLRARLADDPRDAVTGRVEARSRRIVQTVKALANRDTRRSAAQTARIRGWLDGS
ncbi:nucleotidyltransferase domain-containing protein [Qipengyuania atrilutea]|uniref:Nucleotidyltransferase family protein n=1 Tax=Qipengyuania atrilutea TaxID=2744473 RepID=A0A850H232_9SPHN|nr:nucleotidyltransferase family protein [Actirhodobacter atriluteus]NVD44610.1 nucleotidyltransferase family protein [Actirhodobacter atriluteus]